MSYQQAQQAVGYRGQAKGNDDDYALTIGTSVTVAPGRYAGSASYTLSEQETEWRPFSTRTGSSILIDETVPSMVGALAYQAARHPSRPLTDVLMIGTIRDPENYPELSWLTNDPAIDFQHFVMANEHTGYAAAAEASAALRAFNPRGIGMVLLEIEEPYDQVTVESNDADFEANYRGTQWEKMFRPMRLTDGPYWCESMGRTELDHDVVHVLSGGQQQDYDRFLAEVSRTLGRAGHDRIIVLLSGRDFIRTVGRFPVEHFGTRLSGAVHVEYNTRPALRSGGRGPLPDVFPGYEPLISASPSPRAFWYGVNPKSGRVVLARLNDREAPQLLLLVDPPAVPDYWSPSYSALRAVR